MENIYAIMLLYHASKEITEEIVKDILEAAGVIWDGDQILRAVRSFKSANVEEILSTVHAPAVGEYSPTVTEPKVDAKDDDEEPRGIGSLFGDK